MTLQIIWFRTIEASQALSILKNFIFKFSNCYISNWIVEDIGFEPMTLCVQGSALAS